MRFFRVGYIVTVSFLIFFTLITLTLGFYNAPEGPKEPEYPTYNEIIGGETPPVRPLPMPMRGETGTVESMQSDVAIGISPEEQSRILPLPPTATGSSVLPIATPTPNNGMPMPDPYYYNNFRESDYQRRLQQYEKDREKYEEDKADFINDEVVPYVRNVFMIWLVAVIAFELAGILLIKIGSVLTGSAFAFTGIWAVIFGPISGAIFLMNNLASSYLRRGDEQINVESIFQAVGIVGLLGVVVLSAAGYFLENVFWKKKSASDNF